MINYQDKIRIQTDLQKWIKDDIPYFSRVGYSTLFCTINYNLQNIQEYKTLYKIHQRTDRYLLGCRYYKKHPSERSFFIYFTQYTISKENLHHHLLWSIPINKSKRFIDVLEGIVKKVCNSECPKVDVQEINNFNKCLSYISRDIWKTGNNFGLSSQFITG